ALEMVGFPRKAYVLLGVEPEYDCWDGAAALKAVQGAEFVLNLTAYASQSARSYSSVLLPTAAFAETFGTFVNAEGTAQTFQGATKPPGEARPGWKVLRVLGGLLGQQDFDYLDGQQVLDEVLSACSEVPQNNLTAAEGGFEVLAAHGLWRVAEVPLYAGDALVRRAPSLQQTTWARPAAAYLHPQTARERNLEGEQLKVRQGSHEVVLPLVLDERVAQETVMVPAALEGSLALGPMVGPVEIRGA
ncbi:MAG: molybdopterin-dependent oxidoreductase, partial [Candidatus Competibacteraceae bacterium]|nr:molybdopterin-dependent oxidoreductase [Candidatus Competibacteraceae bacterium]